MKWKEINAKINLSKEVIAKVEETHSIKFQRMKHYLQSKLRYLYTRNIILLKQFHLLHLLIAISIFFYLLPNICISNRICKLMNCFVNFVSLKFE